VLYERGHNAPFDGNWSVRLSERALLVTPSAVHKGRLQPDQIVKVRAMDGEPVDRGQRASSELRMHLVVYAQRPDVHAIVHAHSPNTVGLTVAEVSLETPVVPEVILTMGGVPTVPYASPTTEDVPNAVRDVLGRTDAFILERHGAVCLGRDLDEAFVRLETIEHTSRITVAALSAGSAKPIGPAEAEKLRAMALSAGNLRHPAARAEAEDALVERLAAKVLAKIKR
jgi:L-fuculose-phosphate aldolase